jgi:hypothetical protein
MTLQSLYNQIDALIEAEYVAMGKAALVSHIAKRRAIQEAIAALWASATVDPQLDATVGNVIYVSSNKAKQYGRLKRLDETIAGIVKVGAITDIRDIEIHGRNIYQLVYDGYAWVYTKGYGLPMTDGAKVKLVGDALYSDFYGNPFPDLLKRNWAGYYDDIMGAVNRGLNQGIGYRNIARQIQELANTNYKKALRIASTEAHRIQTQAYLDNLTVLDRTGVKYRKKWISISDSYTRTDHVEMDNELADKKGIFHLPDGSTGPAPGHTGSARNDINCRCRSVTIIDLPEIPIESSAKFTLSKPIPMKEIRKAKNG